MFEHVNVLDSESEVFSGCCMVLADLFPETERDLLVLGLHRGQKVELYDMIFFYLSS